MKFYFYTAFSWFIQDICTILLSILIKNTTFGETKSNTDLLLRIQNYKRNKSEYL